MPETAVREAFDVFRATTTGYVKVLAKIPFLPHIYALTWMTKASNNISANSNDDNVITDSKNDLNKRGICSNGRSKVQGPRRK